MQKIGRKTLAIIVVLSMIIGASVIYAGSDTIKKTIEANYMGITLVVDDKKVTLSPDKEPFVYEGTTYLPVRAVGEALGKKVKWDGNTKTVYIGGAETSSNIARLNEDIEFMGKMVRTYLEKEYVGKTYLDRENKGYGSRIDLFTYNKESKKMVKDIMGKEYRNAFGISLDETGAFGLGLTKTYGYVDYPANGEYSTFKGLIGWNEKSKKYPNLTTAIFKVYKDDTLVDTFKLEPSNPSREISVNIKGALKVRIEFMMDEFLDDHYKYSAIGGASVFDPVFVK